MGCDDGGRASLSDIRGQGTVEYALVLFALLAIIIACGTLWRALEGGSFTEHAVDSASHHVFGGSPGALADILLF